MNPSSMNGSKENITPRLNSRISNSQRPSRGRANITSVALRTPKVAAVKTRRRSESKNKLSESLRMPANAMKVKSRNHRHGPLHEQNNRHNQHHKIDSLMSPKQYSPRKREHIVMGDVSSRFNALDPWDTNSLASAAEDMNSDRYASIEQSPIKKRKAAISSFDKGNSILSPIANPLHRFPPRVMQPRRNTPKVRIRSSNIIDRKEQVKRDIAATLARMKVDEPGNVNYDGMPSTKSNKLQHVSHYNGNKDLKPFQSRLKQIFMKNSDETEQMNNTSSVRMSRHRALMDRNANTLSPTSTKASDTSPTYIYVRPSNTFDDEITFYTNGSGITVGRECAELNALNDALCMGLESGVRYATEYTHAHGNELISDMVNNAAQIEGQMVEELHALGETIGNDCEGITGSSYEAANSLLMQMAKQQSYIFGMGKETCGAMDEDTIGNDCEGIAGSSYEAANSLMMQMAKQQSHIFSAGKETCGAMMDENECSNEQTEATTEKRGTLKKLRDAIKKRKEKWFDTVNNAYQMEGETVDEVHAFGEKIGNDCEGIAGFSYEVVDSVLSQIKKDNFLCCAGEEVDDTMDVLLTQRLLDKRSCEDEATSERYDKYGRNLKTGGKLIIVPKRVIIKKGLRGTKGKAY